MKYLLGVDGNVGGDDGLVYLDVPRILFKEAVIQLLADEKRPCN